MKKQNFLEKKPGAKGVSTQDHILTLFDNMETNAAVRGTFAAQSNGVIQDNNPLPGVNMTVKGKGSMIAHSICIGLAILFFIIAFIWAIWAYCKCDDSCDGDYDKKYRNVWPQLLFVLALALAILALYLKL